MAEFRFFATDDESLTMLRDLLARDDVRLVLGQQTLDTPSLNFYTELTADLAEILRRKPKVYLYGPYSTHPPYLAKLKSGPDAGRYFLSDADGGPHVLYLAPSLSPENILRQGALWTQPHYQVTADQLIWATPEVKAAHAAMVKQLKKHLVRWEGLWISPGALQLLKEGKAELPGDLKRLGAVARKLKELPQLSSPVVVPPSSRKTTKRKVAAKTATP